MTQNLPHKIRTLIHVLPDLLSSQIRRELRLIGQGVRQEFKLLGRELIKDILNTLGIPA